MKDINKSLFFHCHKGFITDSITLCCQRYIKDKKKKWETNVLYLLRHSNEQVKVHAYTQCLELLKVYN